MRVLVTGATGFVGRHLVPVLLEAGHELRALSRGERPGSLPAGVEGVRGSIDDRESVRRAAAGMDACVHLTAIIVERGTQTFDRVNHHGTRILLESLGEAGVGRLIHLSALGAGPDERFPYLRSKWLGEEAVRSGGIDSTVLRPSVLYGEGAGFFRPIVWTLRWLPVYPMVEGGRTRFQPLAVRDLASCVVESLAGAAVNQTVDLGGPDVLAFARIVEVVRDALGKRRPIVDVPLWTARPFAWLQERMREPLVTNQQLDMVRLDNVCDPTAIREAFGIDAERFEESDLRWLARL